jgi:hypothetical protein
MNFYGSASKKLSNKSYLAAYFTDVVKLVILFLLVIIVGCL